MEGDGGDEGDEEDEGDGILMSGGLFFLGEGGFSF